MRFGRMLQARADAPEWRWSDLDASPSRWRLFLLSGECLTTGFLWGYALLLWYSYTRDDASTFVASKAFSWLASISQGNELPWSVVALTLAIVAPLAVWFDDGRLRTLGLVLQALFLGFLGTSSLMNNPLGLGWPTFAVAAVWLTARALAILAVRWELVYGAIRRRG